MPGVKVAPIELGEILLEQQAVLEVVAMMLLELVVVGGLAFLLLPGDSEKKQCSMVSGYRDGIKEGWIALKACTFEFAFHRCSNCRIPINRYFRSGTPF